MSNRAFKPAWWLRNTHLQTLWRTLHGKFIAKIGLDRERVELPDGDFIDIDWFNNAAAARFATQPIVLILHGLEGSANSPYAQGMLRVLAQNKWRSAVMHFRGCSGEPNRLPETYHSGQTRDLEAIITLLQQREPTTPIGIIGFSIGGNILLKWLGEATAATHAIRAAVAVSVPFQLDKSVDHLHKGFARIYEWFLLRDMRKKVQQKIAQQQFPLDISPLSSLKTIREFDDKITAPLHGYLGAEDYYKKNSCRQFIKHIQVPTLLLQAEDDPFMPKDVIPEAHELGPKVTLEVTSSGGHVGFLSGISPWCLEYWIEKRAPLFFAQHF